MLTEKDIFNALSERHGLENQKKFANSCVGIAGLGGLGSNIAVYLTRLGIGKLILVDFDNVDITNINRQNYVLSDIGKPKTKALYNYLTQINPYLNYELHQIKVTSENAVDLFSGCDVVCEAFDKADQKAMLIQTLLANNIKVVSGNGMAGINSANLIKTINPIKNLYICGDNQSDISDGLGLMSPRVAICAAHQATMTMRLLLNQNTI